MPTIPQLPSAASVDASDVIPVSQAGATKSVTLGTLLSGIQPAILVGQGSLLGRNSLGPGGPEDVTIGTGLVLNGGTLTATGGGPTVNTTLSVADLPRAASLGSTDLVAVSHAGTTSAVTYAALLNGQTIDQAQAAGVVSGSDTLWVAQQSNMMVRQTFDAIWNWLTTKLPTAHLPVVELSADTTLDRTVHNGRLLVCTEALTLSPVFNNMGNGFNCEVINVGAGNVTFGSGITPTTGNPLLAPNQSATIRAITSSRGNLVLAVVGSGSTGVAPPGSVGSLAASSITVSGAALSWTAPSSGGQVDRYMVRLRTAGATAWTVLADTIVQTSYGLSGLAGGTSYDVAVSAVNATGSGAMTVLSLTTLATGQPPGAVVNLAAATQGTDSVLLSWSAPTTGGAVASYVVQFRLSGTVVWTDITPPVTTTSKMINGLTSATSYDFRVYAIGEGGTGASVNTVTATTLATTGAVSSIVWNMTPTGPYTKGVGAIGVNVIVTPATAAVRMGFSTSATVKPTSWTAATYVNTGLWGAYLATPATAGTWYIWAEGTDGSASTVLTTPFTVV